MNQRFATGHAVSSFFRNASRLACTAALLGSAALANANAPAAMRIVPGLEEPLVATASPARIDDEALSAAVTAFNATGDGKDFTDRAKPLTAFVEAHPASAWRTAVLTDLGLGHYRAGYFLKAIAAWEQAWATGRDATDPQAKALVDRAAGELIRIHTRLGHQDRVEQLLAELEARKVTGQATEAVTSAREGLWLMRTQPGSTYLCGPAALKSLLQTLRPMSVPPAFLSSYKSGVNGVSLAELGALAKRSDLNAKLVLRRQGQAVPVPSLMHWKADHFASVVAFKRGRYHIKDPTVPGGELWVTQAALDAEGSGYFLVPDEQAAAFQPVSVATASQIYGKGDTPTQVPQSTTPDDRKACGGNKSGSGSGGAGLDTQPNKPGGCSEGCGMCVYAVHTMVVSLNLTDTPVGYTPARGPDAHTTLTYNQREANQPAVFTFSNISPKWTLNWLAYVQDSPTSPGTGVLRYVAGGGSINYAGYNSSTGAFTSEPRAAATLVRTGPASYQRNLADGSTETYAQSDGATTGTRRVFLTRKTDPAGNALNLTYDAQLRLIAVTDATGRNTTFAYSISGRPLLVSGITDPFGRSATLAYDSLGRLAQITDVLGLTSQFTYDGSGLITALTTPYGTTAFSFGGTGNSRFLQATDPLGFTERFEFRHEAPGIPFNETPPTAPGLTPFTSYINFRNTFHWDRHAFSVAAGDYTKARIEHWLHDASTGYTSGTLESTKWPLQSRVWYSYPNQPTNIYNGSLDSPVSTARLLDDNTTQSRTIAYNPLGKVTSDIDPLGRKTVYTYAANGIDLLTVQRQTSATGALSTLATFTYNTQHRPLTSTDAGGQTTVYGYNKSGQLTSVTNPLNQVTRYGYDSLGRLVSVVDANGAPQKTLTYDAFDRVATSTDSEGYTLAYSYDALDRVTLVTYPDGTTTQSTYDRLDLSAVKDRLNRTTRYSYDANRRLTAVTDPMAQVTRYGYYRNGTLASITDPRGNVTSWSIDVQSRPTAKRYADGRSETYTYEATTSRLKSVRDALNQVKTYAYFQDDLVRSLAYTGTVNPTPNVSFTYDPYFPRRTAMIDGVGTTRWTYVPVGTRGALQMASEDGPYNNDTVAYTYDAIGRVSTRTVDVAGEDFVYDAIGRLVNHNSALGSFNMAYLGATSQMTSQASSTGTVSTQWAYEGNANDRRLRTITNSGAARSYSFATTPENLITGITENISKAAQRTINYAYDDAYRLTGVTASAGSPASYRYDAADNLTNINGAATSYNSVNQIQAFGSVPYSYDANGNLLNDGIRTYGWDAENRLINIGYIGFAGRSSSFRYDGIGRRLAIVDINSGIATENRQLWCGPVLCQGRNVTDTVTRRYFDEGQVIPQSNNLLYYGKDFLGSVRDLLAVQSGSKIASFDYDAFGLATSTSGRTTSEFRYAGLFYHGSSGLYLTNYRAYDPKSSRWLSRDPLAESGGLNLYAYVGNNPISFVDLQGLAGTPPPGIPYPPDKIPGGPWEWIPDPNNPRGGNFYGQKPSSGPRPMCTYAEPGSVNSNAEPYWKTVDPDGAKQRYNAAGEPRTAKEVHPSPKLPTPWLELIIRMLIRVPIIIIPGTMPGYGDPNIA